MKKFKTAIVAMAMILIAGGSVFVANNKSLSRIASNNIEALSVASNTEYRIYCGSDHRWHTIVEEWVEKESSTASYYHYTGSYGTNWCSSDGYHPSCRQDRRLKARKGGRDPEDHCYHDNSRSWPMSDSSLQN